MANEVSEIGDIVKKCKVLLLDIEGTTTSISFVKDKLFPYAEENVKEFLEGQWETDDVKEAVVALRKLALEDQEKSLEGVVTIPAEDASKEEQIEGLVKSVKWLMSADRKDGPLKQLQGLIWKQGYDKGDIKGHVYDDVLPALEQWRSTEDRKVYIYSSGSVQAQKLLFGQSMAGDMLKVIDGHFDTAVGQKQEEASYKAIVEKIGVPAEEILFLTDILKEAEAARAATLQAALVSRAGNAPLPEAPAFPVLHSLAELAVTNKRKPDTQVEQPAKIPKTDTTDDVKSNSEVEAPVEMASSPVEEKNSEPEKMEVEEDSPETESKDEPKEETEPEKSPDTVVEEVTDSNEPVDPAVVTSDIEPVVEEKQDTPEEMDDETVSNGESAPKENGATNGGATEAPSDESSSPVLIEDVTDKQPLDEVTEIIEDLEPVVEEPPAAEDMEVLQNVGEVLEKECDEILSKVQDVTNLDNIPGKPHLNPIAEETMETDNADADIVDRILDSEMELKQCADIDLDSVSEMTEATKPESVSSTDATKGDSESSADEPDGVKIEEKEPISKIENGTVEEKPSENGTAESEVVEETKEESVPLEAKVEEAKIEEPEKIEEPVEESKEDKVESSPAPTETAPPEDIVTETTNNETVVAEEVKPNETPEPHVNGKATNGDAEVAVNGDASKDEELNSRLSAENVENGQNGNIVNGTNGKAADDEKEPAEKKDVEVPEIKVKTVAAAEEPRTDPIEQPTEA